MKQVEINWEEKLKRELEEIHNQKIYINNDYSRYDER